MHATEKNAKLVDVVALALQRKTDHKYLVTRRGPGQAGAGEWEFPGGKIEQGETQTGALVREIFEELSLIIHQKDLIFVAENIEHYSSKSVRIFLWKLSVEQTPPLVLTEHDQSRWLSPSEMTELGLSAGDKPFVSRL